MLGQFDLFPTEVLLRRIDPATNKWRFYHLSIEGGLFGDWCLVRRWGRIGTEPPRVCRRPFGLIYAANAGASSMA